MPSLTYNHTKVRHKQQLHGKNLIWFINSIKVPAVPATIIMSRDSASPTLPWALRAHFYCGPSPKANRN